MTITQEMSMGSEPKKPWGPEDDQKKPFTPQERRNEDVEWKVHDMPDEDPDVNKADPEHDYERPDGSEKR
ncbi:MULTISPECIES: hypothetical protein [Xanthomonas]|uniref:hypothetical protein n=1 Tax=Xanthomonas TaxID=338 RepID=UPI0006E537B9|nr:MULTISPECIES: hypothetical protein [Xanthomonas]MBO9746112.1 hypothetical protein [Xanthomonas phaseoli pv. dieffenbachiae]MBV6837262.1 hypothetical protein [Xanthomonas campestris pv. merremiae]MEE5089365.1 hypothetical protein [Xanthomonas euvesicatoria]ATS40902.2 hypothetical protein XcfCFBP6988P_21580 [Xanthomonas citri pv. phaseoli var. fuscans]ATS45156.2 hypothetical protein XcfCFBP6989P_21685 [Xanthomonas citri pv. phaseoli var. fuscans]